MYACLMFVQSFSLITPVNLALVKLEKDTRYWPMVYNDTIVYTLSQVLWGRGGEGRGGEGRDRILVLLRLFPQELEPLPQVVKRDAMSDSELEECKKVHTHPHTV